METFTVVSCFIHFTYEIKTLNNFTHVYSRINMKQFWENKSKDRNKQPWSNTIFNWAAIYWKQDENLPKSLNTVSDVKTLCVE